MGKHGTIMTMAMCFVGSTSGLFKVSLGFHRAPFLASLFMRFAPEPKLACCYIWVHPGNLFGIKIIKASDQTQTVASVCSSVMERAHQTLDLLTLPWCWCWLPHQCQELTPLAFKESKGVEDHRQKAFTHLHAVFRPCGFSLAALCGCDLSM